ncbi:hypothetical protein FACS189499_04820 [Clostridia bacterium]|nr:hypothetical protein FACS189499_04820 [Clostridia bacterium]
MSRTLQELSIVKWTGNEVLDWLEEQEEFKPVLVLEPFRKKMDEYGCMNETFGFIFRRACLFVEEVIDPVMISY